MNEETNIPKSPSIVKLEMEHKMEMENIQQQNTLRSCCYDLDKNAVQYFTTISVICSIMGFCIFKLITDETCVGQQAYMGLLTLCIGIVAPSPTFKK